MDTNQVAEIFKGFLTPLIAIVAVFIAFQQWKTNQQKLNLDLYDRRMRIYEEVKKILFIIEKDATASKEDLWRFYSSVSDADFLFEAEISKYINEIYKRGFALHIWNEKYRDYTQNVPAGYNHDEVVKGKDTELSWLIEQFEPAKDKFKKYLYYKSNL
jgi:hypothetical protein